MLRQPEIGVFENVDRAEAISEGVARQPGTFVRMAAKHRQGGHLIDLSRLSPRERLAAEQAILTLRALDQAADDAPEGQGLACLERVITDRGLRHLRDLLTSAASARDEAQKRGPALEAARAVARRSSRRPTRAAS